MTDEYLKSCLDASLSLKKFRVTLFRSLPFHNWHKFYKNINNLKPNYGNYRIPIIEDIILHDDKDLKHLKQLRVMKATNNKFLQSYNQSINNLIKKLKYSIDYSDKLNIPFCRKLGEIPSNKSTFHTLEHSRRSLSYPCFMPHRPYGMLKHNIALSCIYKNPIQYRLTKPSDINNIIILYKNNMLRSLRKNPMLPILKAYFVINSKYSAYRIAKELNLTQAGVGKIRNKKTKWSRTTMHTINELNKFYKSHEIGQQIKSKAKSINFHVPVIKQ